MDNNQSNNTQLTENTTPGQNEPADLVKLFGNTHYVQNKTEVLSQLLTAGVDPAKACSIANGGKQVSRATITRACKKRDLLQLASAKMQRQAKSVFLQVLAGDPQVQKKIDSDNNEIEVPVYPTWTNRIEVAKRVADAVAPVVQATLSATVDLTDEVLRQYQGRKVDTSKVIDAEQVKT